MLDITNAPPPIPPFPCSYAQFVETGLSRCNRKQRKELKSAGKRFAEIAARDGDTWILYSLDDLWSAIDAMRLGKDGSEARYLEALASKLMRIARLNGVHVLAHKRLQLPPLWAARLAAARNLNKTRAGALEPFAEFLIRRDLEPSQEAYEAFCADVDTWERKTKLVLKQQTHREWTYFVDRLPEWPQIRIELASRRNDYMLPEHKMPRAVAEFDQWSARPLQSHWRHRKSIGQVTVASRRYTFRRIVSAALAADIPLQQLQTMHDVCQPDVLEKAFAFILARNDQDVE